MRRRCAVSLIAVWLLAGESQAADATLVASARVSLPPTVIVRTTDDTVLVELINADPWMADVRFSGREENFAQWAGREVLIGAPPVDGWRGAKALVAIHSR